MAIKQRSRRRPAQSVEDFIAAGADTVASDPTEEAPVAATSSEAPVASPSKPARTSSTKKTSVKRTPGEVEAWIERAQSDKDTEGQPLRFNRSQQDLLHYAKTVEDRPFSKIIANILWPALEAQYGDQVPIRERGE